MEDESWVRKGMIKMIRWNELGMELIGEAENGENVERVLAEKHADLLITDIRMPKVNGMQLLKRIEESGIDCEVVILSGFSDYEYMKQAIHSGVAEYLLKPIDELELNRVMENVISKIVHKRREKEVLSSLVVEQALQRLIRGESYTAELPPELKVNLYYSVMAVVIKNPASHDSHDSHDSQPILLEVIQSIVQDRLHSIVFTNEQQDIILLCSTEHYRSGAFQTEQQRIAEHIIGRLAEKYGFEARVGIGEAKSGRQGIMTTYREARNALCYEKTVDSDIIFFHEIKDVKAIDDLRIIEDKQLAYLIEKGFIEEINDLIVSFFSAVRRKKYIKLSKIRKAVMDFMLAVTKSVGENIGLDLDRMESMISLSRLEQWTLTMVEKLMVTPDRVRPATVDIVEEIKSYIDHNYQEDINLIQLAQKYYINHIYLSRLFKQQTGENFMDYLIRIRMLKAREIMKRGHLKIREVAELVGYNNPYYFSKNYKKYFSDETES